MAREAPHLCLTGCSWGSARHPQACCPGSLLSSQLAQKSPLGSLPLGRFHSCSSPPIPVLHHHHPSRPSRPDAHPHFQCSNCSHLLSPAACRVVGTFLIIATFMPCLEEFIPFTKLNVLFIYYFFSLIHPTFKNLLCQCRGRLGRLKINQSSCILEFLAQCEKVGNIRTRRTKSTKDGHVNRLWSLLGAVRKAETSQTRTVGEGCSWQTEQSWRRARTGGSG